METGGGDGGSLECGEEGREVVVLLLVVVVGGFTAETSGGFNLGLVKIHLIKSET